MSDPFQPSVDKPSKTKRNVSHSQCRISTFGGIKDSQQLKKDLRPKLKSIKITKNKLPPDFFPTSDCQPKNIQSTRSSTGHASTNDLNLVVKKTCSQKDRYSPEKTSFFGFYESSYKNKESNTISFKRQLESRNEVKHEKIFKEPRYFTPSTGMHRSDLLSMFPAKHDQAQLDALKCSKKSKQIALNGRKEHKTKVEVSEWMMTLEVPQQVLVKEEKLKMSSSVSTNIHNITFCNMKSTSLPPIVKNSLN